MVRRYVHFAVPELDSTAAAQNVIELTIEKASELAVGTGRPSRGPSYLVAQVDRGKPGHAAEGQTPRVALGITMRWW